MTLNVETRHAIHPAHAKTMDTAGIRANFLSEGLFKTGEINLTYTHYDRFVVGGAVPAGAALTLAKVAEAGTENFLDRREMGVVNVGDSGTVEADGTTYPMEKGDVLYLGMGTGAVTFAGQGRFYITSCPAHHTYDSRLVAVEDAVKVELGAPETANKRTIKQFIHPLVMETCQLVMGYTELDQGSVWNTIPSHTHDRRMEAYLYWNMDDAARVLHLMGEPTETRHIFVANEECVVSPPWSIHSGAGIGKYSFIWAMAGDNVDFTDMDFVDPADMR